jgi:hypothetical protein
MATYVSPPSLSGTMRESPLYQTMGVGFTDRVFLLGHADGLAINDPYRVNSVQEAVNALGADSTAPLLRAMLETYYSGCRDIYIVAAAPMSEYVGQLEDRLIPQFGGLNFYEKYHERLAATYSLLLDFDLLQIVVPVEASFINTGAADFLGQLTAFCQDAFTITGVIPLGLLGTRGKLDEATIDELAADPRLLTQGDAGKFVALLAGEATLNLKELPTIYATSVASSVAGELSRLRFDHGLTYHRLGNVISPTHADLTKAQITKLAEAKVNPLIRTIAGKRGVPFQCVLATDNTLADFGSDYWSLTQMRLVARMLDRIRSLGRRFIGTIGFGEFKAEVHAYLVGLMADGSVRGATADIRRSDPHSLKVLVDVVVQPYFGIREVTFSCEVGPSEV